MSRPTILAARVAFTERGIEGIRKSKKRKRSSRALTPEVEQKILETTLKTRPADATHWSVRVLAAKLDVSRMMVQRVWQHYDIQSHRVEKFKISKDPNLKTRCGTSLACISTRQTGPWYCASMKRARSRRWTEPLFFPCGRDYRNARRMITRGTEPPHCLPRHGGKEFIRFLHQLEQQVPPELDLHLILDNYSTHKSAAVQRWLKPMKRLRLHFHFTPTSSS